MRQGSVGNSTLRPSDFWSKCSSEYYQYVQPNRYLPFLATLDLPDLSKLINDPIRHNPSWPPILVKLPSDIPKFDGKQGDDPKNHVMTFHLWCSSNSLMDDSIQLWPFQRTLTVRLQSGTLNSHNIRLWILAPWQSCFSHTFSSLFVMKQTLIF